MMPIYDSEVIIDDYIGPGADEEDDDEEPAGGGDDDSD